MVDIVSSNLYKGRFYGLKEAGPGPKSCNKNAAYKSALTQRVILRNDTVIIPTVRRWVRVVPTISTRLPPSSSRRLLHPSQKQPFDMPTHPEVLWAQRSSTSDPKKVCTPLPSRLVQEPDDPETISNLLNLLTITIILCLY